MVFQIFNTSDTMIQTTRPCRNAKPVGRKVFSRWSGSNRDGSSTYRESLGGVQYVVELDTIDELLSLVDECDRHAGNELIFGRTDEGEYYIEVYDACREE